ncbi:hypothetical protein RGQ29_009736 [Quercus rubra]|uniref:Uncharacterized protein n=1 Tax=Quercus rubra TaxID=3512 RepID=A0AAN7FWI1_QUERU|nr:hypothetical protein RGQ29_009736 [Quercus rubra]
MKKVKHLLELPRALTTHLIPWKADLNGEGSFDEAIKGCDGVFHVATPMDFESKDPELVFTSSAAAVRFGEHEKPVYDENCWTDVEFCRNKKMTGWLKTPSMLGTIIYYILFAKENNLDFITIIPPLVVGSFLRPSMPPSLITAFSPITVIIEHVVQFTWNEAHYSILKQTQFVHLDDLRNAHIFPYEHPKAEGRYICSGCDATIHDVAKLLREKFPEYNVPKKFKDVDENLEIISFSSKKIKELGFGFKYNLEDMYVGAVETCQGKGLLPPTSSSRKTC